MANGAVMTAAAVATTAPAKPQIRRPRRFCSSSSVLPKSGAGSVRHNAIRDSSYQILERNATVPLHSWGYVTHAGECVANAQVRGFTAGDVDGGDGASFPCTYLQAARDRLGTPPQRRRGRGGSRQRAGSF